jgi:hypothetical protein
MSFALRRQAFVLGLLAFALLALPAVAQETDSATITVVHAVPGEGGFPADIYLNGEVVLDSMVFEAVSEPVEVPAGEVGVQIFVAGSDAATDTPLIDQSVTLDAGVDYTAVAQLIDGDPAVALYVNDLSPVPAGEARLTIRQSSAEGPLDVMVNGIAVVSRLAAPNEVTVELSAGPSPLTIMSAEGVGLVDQQVDVPAGALFVLYAVGSSADETFAVLTQQVTTPQETPAGVPTGTGGAREQAGHAGWLSVPAMFVAAVVFAVRPKRARVA